VLWVTTRQCNQNLLWANRYSKSIHPHWKWLFPPSFENTLHQSSLIMVSCSKTQNVALYWKSLLSPRTWEEKSRLEQSVREYKRSWSFSQRRCELVDLGWKIPLSRFNFWDSCFVSDKFNFKRLLTFHLFLFSQH
jgi:hypothetical protein